MNKDDRIKLEIMTRELRLNYYNNYLLENGIITKREHNTMNLIIMKESSLRRKKELGEISFEERYSTARHR